MDSILTDQIEWLISGNMEGLRFKRQLLLLTGCLADGAPPENIGEELSRLTQRIASEEVFHALLDSLNAYIRNKDKEQTNLDMSGLIAQLEASREELKQCQPANTTLILCWVLGKAKERRLLGKIRGQR
ncbi:hypothetical protein [Ferribacterium limneticum]|uniref:hypothetical protein n=1 Tax=Ferribacterium limneticum TaxID=76259 RepID=UPI001CF8A162|nr:hypothetical protein [Ferribacterium limneticum]UCV22543.1 hypothetical protein KI613_18850 [Ferribacterium limneticum]